jgi:Fur family peroxide stress response transcriptional regulator
VIEFDDALAALSRAGLKRTPQRIAVIESLVGNRSHPTVDDVWSTVRQGMPSISKSTVYATLRELESLGLIQYVPDDEAVRVDPDVVSHAHFTCEACGRVYDIEDGGLTDEIRDAVERRGHTIDRAGIVLRGTCASCARGGRDRRTLHA